MKVYKILDRVAVVVGHLTIIGVNAYMIFVLLRQASWWYIIWYPFGMYSCFIGGVMWLMAYMWYLSKLLGMIIAFFKNRKGREKDDIKIICK